MKEIFMNIIIPILIAVVTYLILKKIDEWKSRRTNSILGVVIIESLIEEVNTGLLLMKDVLDDSMKLDSIASLPNKSWSGMSTIPDEVMLRIIQTAKKLRPHSFPPKQIRSHCKNYFDHMASTWDNTISNNPFWREQIRFIITASFYKASENVLIMLLQTKDLLEENSKKLFPK